MQSTPDVPFRPSRAFSFFTGGLIVALSLTLIFGLTHESSEPTILRRYSAGYFALLLALAVGTGALLWLLLAPRPAFVRWAGNLYAMLVSTILVVVCAEIGLRVINPWGMELFSLLPYHMQGMVDHAQLGYVHPKSIAYRLGKNRVSLNAHGLRDDEIPLEKPASERRILVLGDSVAFGWGVDQGEDFPSRLEVLLREGQNKNWQVINAGVNGYNSEQEAIYLQKEGMRFQPDIVLLVYVSNDVDPTFDPNEVTWRRYPSWPSSLPELLDRARSVSYLYQATKLFQRMKETAPVAEGPPPTVTDHPRWPDSLGHLRSIANLCRSQNVRFMIAVLASDDEKAVNALRQAGIETISLGQAWSRVAPKNRLVSRIDPHPSAAVHLEIAKQFKSEMQDRGWLSANLLK